MKVCFEYVFFPHLRAIFIAAALRCQGLPDRPRPKRPTFPTDSPARPAARPIRTTGKPPPSSHDPGPAENISSNIPPNASSEPRNLC